MNNNRGGSGNGGEEETVWTDTVLAEAAATTDDDVVVPDDVETALDTVTRESESSDRPAPPADETESTDMAAVRETVLADVRDAFQSGETDLEFAPAPAEEFVADSWFDFDYLTGRVEVERAWVNEPYAYVSVLYDATAKEYEYHVVEPTLDGFETYVRRDLTRILRDSLLYQDLDDEEDRAGLFEREAKSVVADHAATIEGGTLYKLLYYLTRDFVEYGKIDPMMRDPAIEDISCDGSDVPVFVYHRDYRDLETNVRFGAAALDSFTVRLAQRAGKSISVSNPLVDASLPNGARVQLTLGGEIATRGSNFTVRKFSEVPYTPVDLIGWNTFSVDEMAYLWLAIENGRSLVFAGGTGSGKTTSMNAVSFFIPPNSKVVSIEDTREITLPHDNWVQSVTRSAVVEGGRGEVDMYRLLQASLRQRPEYILVGEIRTEARVALTFFQAIGTGHTAYTTIHADSIEGVMARLQNDPLSIPAQMIKNLDIVSIQRQVRTEGERVRRNQAIVEILPGGEGNDVVTRTVFSRDPATDTHNAENPSHLMSEIRDDRGWDDDRLERELSVREEILTYLVENDITDYDDVTAIVHTFEKDPEYIVERLRAGELATGVHRTLDESSADTTPSETLAAPDDGVTDTPIDRTDADLPTVEPTAAGSDEPADTSSAAGDHGDGDSDEDATGDRR